MVMNNVQGHENRDKDSPCVEHGDRPVKVLTGYFIMAGVLRFVKQTRIV